MAVLQKTSRISGGSLKGEPSVSVRSVCGRCPGPPVARGRGRASSHVLEPRQARFRVLCAKSGQRPPTGSHCAAPRSPSDSGDRGLVGLRRPLRPEKASEQSHCPPKAEKHFLTSRDKIKHRENLSKRRFMRLLFQLPLPRNAALRDSWRVSAGSKDIFKSTKKMT